MEEPSNSCPCIDKCVIISRNENLLFVPEISTLTSLHESSRDSPQDDFASSLFVMGNDDDGNLAVAGNVRRHRAQQQAAEPRMTLRADHHEVGVGVA